MSLLEVIHALKEQPTERAKLILELCYEIINTKKSMDSLENSAKLLEGLDNEK